MILILDNIVLPNIKPDLSDLVESFYFNSFHYDVYRNRVVDKYEMSKLWNVPFLELLHSSSVEGRIDVKIGTYDFESVKKESQLLPVFKLGGSYIQTFYDFTNCPRHEGPISFYHYGLEYYYMERVEATYHNLGNHIKEKRYPNGFVELKDVYSNELVSFTFVFRKNETNFEISSDDLVHRLVNYDVNNYMYRRTNYKKAIFLSYNPPAWYDYGEAQSVFTLKEILKKIESLIRSGLSIEDIDFETFGNKFDGEKIVGKFRGYIEYDNFISCIASSIVKETEAAFILEFDKELSSKMIPFYRFLFEKLFANSIEQSLNGEYYMRIDKGIFEEKESIVPFLLFNIMSIIDNSSDYFRYIHTKKCTSDERYSKLINFKETIRCVPFELRIKDILKIKAKDEYRVIYRTGDRDDEWWTEKSLELVFNCEIDTATIYVIKQTIPGITNKGNTFMYTESESGHCDRHDVGHSEDNSDKYRLDLITHLCKAMYSLYKSGIWDR